MHVQLERLIFWNRHSSKPRVDLAEGDRDAMNAKDDEPEGMVKVVYLFND